MFYCTLKFISCRKNCAFNEKDIQAIGRVYGHELKSGSTFILNGKHNFDQFGFYVKMAPVGKQMKLFITAGTEGRLPLLCSTHILIIVSREAIKQTRNHL